MTESIDPSTPGRASVREIISTNIARVADLTEADWKLIETIFSDVRDWTIREGSFQADLVTLRLDAALDHFDLDINSAWLIGSLDRTAHVNVDNAEDLDTITKAGGTVGERLDQLRSRHTAWISQLFAEEGDAKDWRALRVSYRQSIPDVDQESPHDFRIALQLLMADYRLLDLDMRPVSVARLCRRLARALVDHPRADLLRSDQSFRRAVAGLADAAVALQQLAEMDPTVMLDSSDH